MGGIGEKGNGTGFPFILQQVQDERKSGGNEGQKDSPTGQTVKANRRLGMMCFKV